MLRLGDWKFQTALLVGLSTTVALAAEPDQDDGPVRGHGVLVRLFSQKPKAKDKKPADSAAKDAAKKPSPPITSPASVRAREQTDYLRRMAVCDQILQVAYDTKDEELQRHVEQLKERVWTTYQLRSAQVPAGAKLLESDEQILDKHLGSRAAAKDRPEEVLLGTAPNAGRTGRTALKEDKP
jgi:hypothetical protein